MLCWRSIYPPLNKVHQLEWRVAALIIFPVFFYDFGISQSIKALDQDPIFLVVWGCSVVIVIHEAMSKSTFASFKLNTFTDSLLNGDQ